jgi:ribosomal protein S27E
MPPGSIAVKPKCPGSRNLRTPELIIKTCPGCANSVEIFSDEISTVCRICGKTLYREIESCVIWCSYAETCLGAEEYKKIMEKLSPGNRSDPGA